PSLVAEVAFTEWTRDGRMRHPSFQGLREDKPAREVVRETNADEKRVELTHPDRILYPEQGVTKRALARYYQAVAACMLPRARGRPTMLVRCPEGWEKDCFHQKHARPGTPDVLRRVRIREKGKVGRYLVFESAESLIALVQMGTLEIHTWNATA